jgi:hypothetical protein
MYKIAFWKENFLGVDAAMMSRHLKSVAEKLCNLKLTRNDFYKFFENFDKKTLNFLKNLKKTVKFFEKFASPALCLYTFILNESLLASWVE